MFTKMEQGMNVYRQELENYKEFIAKIKKLHPPGTPAMLYDDDDYKEIVIRNREMRKMEEVGVKKAEVDRILKEFGILPG